MTVRVYLAAVRLLDGSPEPGDLPAERMFIHASDVPEIWVETESVTLPGPGKSVAFSLARNLDIGIGRIVGAVERLVSKQSKERLQAI